MELKPNMWVTNPRQPAWGIGKVLRQEGDKVRVLFSEAGEKAVDMRFVTLEEILGPADAGTARPKLLALTGVNMVELEGLCHMFHAQFKDRRSNTDDGSMAIRVLEDMRRRGDLTKDTARQLFSWCHTGASYTEGIDLAQQICRLVYGRVPTRAEIEAAGL